jgi:hypothetical protein
MAAKQTAVSGRSTAITRRDNGAAGLIQDEKR